MLAGSVAGAAIEGIGYGGVCQFNCGPMDPPAETSMSLIKLLQKCDEGDFLRAVTKAALRTPMIDHRRPTISGAASSDAGGGFGLEMGPAARR